MCTCGICDVEELELSNMTHLSLYLVGSEGVLVCLECRMRLTNYARDLKSISGRAKLDGFRLGIRKRGESL